MNEPKKPFIIIVSGPNGAGKTTFYDKIISQNIFLSDTVFLNCDNEIATLKKLPEYSVHYSNIAQEKQTYISGLRFINTVATFCPMVYTPKKQFFHKNANELSDLNTQVSRHATKNMRQKIKDAFTNQQNIIFETTSTASKMKRLAAKYGYDIYGFHICVLEPELSVERVQSRVKKGGHDIPHPIILQRYKENLKTLSKTISAENSAVVIDNSDKQPFRPIFALYDGNIIEISECPEYLQETYKNLLKQFPQKSLKETLHIEDSIDMQSLTPQQRKTFMQVMLLNLLGKVAWQR